MANISQKTEDKHSVSAQNGLEFTLNLYKEIITGNKENIFVSPLSISLALGMTLAGAREDTAKQMKQVLKLESFDTETAIHESFHDIINSLLESNNSAIKLHVANRMYVHDKTNILPEFKNILEKYYNTSSNVVDFEKDAEKIRLEINKWVEDQTQNKIKDLIASGILNALTRLVLVNAIYFKGNWHEKFDSRDTHPDYFYMGANKAVTTDLMHITEKFKYAEDENLKCKILELPYVDETLSMFIILPTEIDGLSKLEESLTAFDLKNIMSKMNRIKVIVTLPKFKIESTLSLQDILSSMGMNNLFSENVADLSGITGNRDLFVSAVLHKAFLEVNEEGSEAAAATAIEFMLCCLTFDPEFRADHPFLLFIRDNCSGSILFWGRVVNPNPNAEIKDVKT